MPHARSQSMQTNKDSRQVREREAMRELGDLPRPSLVDINPEDPSQLLDDAHQYSIVDLDIEAKSRVEADAELDAAVASVAGEEGYVEGGLEEDDSTAEDEADGAELDTPSQTTADAYAAGASDTGELYGVHVPPVADNDLDMNRDGESFRDSELGEHAFETLQKKMTELGAEPEQELDIVDDSDGDRGHHSSGRRDRPGG